MVFITNRYFRTDARVHKSKHLRMQIARGQNGRRNEIFVESHNFYHQSKSTMWLLTQCLLDMAWEIPNATAESLGFTMAGILPNIFQILLGVFAFKIKLKYITLLHKYCFVTKLLYYLFLN